MTDHKGLNITIWLLLLSVVAMGAGALLYRPAYTEGYQRVLETLANALSGALGAAWGLSLPKPNPTQPTPPAA